MRLTALDPLAHNQFPGALQHFTRNASFPGNSFLAVFYIKVFPEFMEYAGKAVLWIKQEHFHWTL